MNSDIKIRLQELTDAERFFEILNSPKFIYFGVKPESIGSERVWLAGNQERQKNNTEWNYSILKNNEVIGAIGVKINFHRNYIGEIGYFLDEKFWGKGITTEVVKIIEKICFNELKLKRLEIVMQPENIASEQVAVNNGYLKEGLMRKSVLHKDGTLKDCFLYSKIL